MLRNPPCGEFLEVGERYLRNDLIADAGNSAIASPFKSLSSRHPVACLICFH
jgi:hypothetical protein